MYAEFFRAVRLINSPRVPRSRLRVLLGDPPVNWETVHSWADLSAQVGGRNQDRFVETVIRREVMNHRHVLVIYGDGHFQARAERPPRSLLARLDVAGISTLAISNAFADLASLQPEVASWRVPSLALLRGTTIGHKSFGFFYPFPPGANVPIEFERHFDAVLYLGPPPAKVEHISPALCGDAAYMAMREHRMSLSPGAARSPSTRSK